ncbi:putative disease resistance protein At1g50180 [Humulus lupulus]|uniref:putative disease resistance protein At1g50180 n=1 Tax=Humulus lupulus TaxID=3486 RepID=UPI002B411D2A|nr:putative disease resistance protein At1g50180 [Humulus lupulus]
MAEAELFSLAKSVGKLIQSEFQFLSGVEDQVNKAKLKLEIMSASLEDADAHVRSGNKTVRIWVSKLREESYDLEDVIETYVLKVVSNNASGGEEIVSNIHDWTSELQSCGVLQRSLDQAAETSSKRAEEQRELRRTHSHVVDNDVVGFDRDIKELVAVLTEKEDKHGVISVCGMGGLGKTTLARKVYHHPQVRDYFDCFAWASITQQCVVREIWEGILFGLISPNTKEKREEIRSMSDSEMSKELYELQKEKKCLVLLDDIWTTSTWDSLKDAFPEEETKSKILLTTRKTGVALHVDPRCFIHELHYLNENESWKLFQNKVRAYPTGDKFYS